MVATTGDDGNPDAEDPIDRESSRVQAVVAWFPPTDLINWAMPGGYRTVNKLRPDLLPSLFAEVTDMEAQLKSISPIYQVTERRSAAAVDPRRSRPDRAAATVPRDEGQVRRRGTRREARRTSQGRAHVLAGHHGRLFGRLRLVRSLPRQTVNAHQSRFGAHRMSCAGCCAPATHQWRKSRPAPRPLPGSAPESRQRVAYSLPGHRGGAGLTIRCSTRRIQMGADIMVDSAAATRPHCSQAAWPSIKRGNSNSSGRHPATRSRGYSTTVAAVCTVASRSLRQLSGGLLHAPRSEEPASGDPDC